MSNSFSDRSDSPPPLEPADADYTYEPDQFGDIRTYRDRPVRLRSVASLFLFDEARPALHHYMHWGRRPAATSRIGPGIPRPGVSRLRTTPSSRLDGLLQGAREPPVRTSDSRDQRHHGTQPDGRRDIASLKLWHDYLIPWSP